MTKKELLMMLDGLDRKTKEKIATGIALGEITSSEHFILLRGLSEFSKTTAAFILLSLMTNEKEELMNILSTLNRDKEQLIGISEKEKEKCMETIRENEEKMLKEGEEISKLLNELKEKEKKNE